MNKGKICISVCAKNTDELLEKIGIAEKIGDIIELRFDCLNKEDIPNALKKISSIVSEKPFLITFRPKTQGGCRDLSIDERNDFWSILFKINPKNVIYADLEFDLTKTFPSCEQKIIRSFHDFEGCEKDLEKFLSNTGEISKIAVQTNTITDSMAVWKLIETAKNREIIPIAMGEAGKWTRILGLAYGSPITYASLEDGNETAPGQISATDLIEVYHAKELNKQTEIYGIVGNPVSHSLSPYIHNAAFQHHKLNAVYIPFEINNLDDFIKRMVRKETREIDWNLKGFSVTIPHKEAILKHLDFIDDDAKAIGAINTVKVVGGKLHGYNTDAEGFINPLRKALGDLKNTSIGIIGNGGAARACVYALKKDRAKITIFARDTNKAAVLAKEFDIGLEDITALDSELWTLDCLVNTSPLGTNGKLQKKTPVSTKHIKNIHLAYDLVYNPMETLFLRDAKSAGIPTINGLEMLVAQGMKQFEIWTKLEIPTQIMKETALKRLKEKTNR